MHQGRSSNFDSFSNVIHLYLMKMHVLSILKKENEFEFTIRVYFVISMFAKSVFYCT